MFPCWVLTTVLLILARKSHWMESSFNHDHICNKRCSSPGYKESQIFFSITNSSCHGCKNIFFFLKKGEIVITKCPNAEYSEKELMIPKELYVFFPPLYWFQPKFSDPCFTAGKYSMRLSIQYIPLYISVSGSSLCRLYKLQKLIKFPGYITFWFKYI